jgi:Ca2+-binding EF-hand superfamily protein
VVRHKDQKANMLAALASSRGVRRTLQWYDEAVSADVVGKKGEQDFSDMMKERADGFGHADLDKDGKLDFEEFCAMVKYRETKEYSPRELKDKFHELDEDGSGKVDLHEFISYCLRDALKRSKGRAIDIFQIWDEDNSGYIDVKEFGKAVVALGFVAGREDIQKVFNSLDDDKSGQIEYKELQRMLRRTATAPRSATPPLSRGSSTAGAPVGAPSSAKSAWASPQPSARR